MSRLVSPAVRAAAERLGVDLETVKATGVGGRIKRADVQAAARPAPSATPAPLQRPASQAGDIDIDEYMAQGSGRSQHAGPGEDSFRYGARSVHVDAYAKNPLAEAAKIGLPGTYRAAVADAAVPTLFETGDLPAFTASGIAPDELLKLPWSVRHMAAREPDRGQVLQMFEDYQNDPIWARYKFGAAEGNRRYSERIDAWLVGPSHRPPNR